MRKLARVNLRKRYKGTIRFFQRPGTASGTQTECVRAGLAKCRVP